MTNAEKAGLEAYPENISYSTIGDVMYDYNAEKRRVYVAGYEQGYKDVVDKACKWLLDRMWVMDVGDEPYVCESDASDVNEFIGDFKKAIEGEL